MLNNNDRTTTPRSSLVNLRECGCPCVTLAQDGGRQVGPILPTLPRGQTLVRVSCKCGVGKRLRGATPHHLHTTVYDVRSVERPTGRPYKYRGYRQYRPEREGIPISWLPACLRKTKSPQGKFSKGIPRNGLEGRFVEGQASPIRGNVGGVVRKRRMTTSFTSDPVESLGGGIVAFYGWLR